MPGTTSGNRLNTKSLRIFQACTFVVVYEVVRVSSFCFAFNGNDITAFDSAICLGCLQESGRLNVFPAKRFTDSVMHFDRLQGLARISARCFIGVRPAARVVFFRRSVT